MKLSDFLKDKLSVDVHDNQDVTANKIRSALANWQPTPPLEKELSQLSEEEILVVFGALYPIPQGQFRVACEVIQKAREDMNGYV